MENNVRFYQVNYSSKKIPFKLFKKIFPGFHF